MNPFGELLSLTYVLPINDIDTDQIIPARYLKVTDQSGLGAALFADWRYLPDGALNPDFALNQQLDRNAQILVAGNNFGCGSSREHAPWALIGFGLKAIISTEFADIFRNNALKNGLLPIQLTSDQYQVLLSYLAEYPAAKLRVDLGKQIVLLENGVTLTLPIDAFSKTCLLEGVDELGYLMQLDEKIDAFEQTQSVDRSGLR